jgi:hypothetical protein
MSNVPLYLNRRFLWIMGLYIEDGKVLFPVEWHYLILKLTAVG